MEGSERAVARTEREAFLVLFLRIRKCDRRAARVIPLPILNAERRRARRA
jgi:hypothetical protein